MADYGHWQRDYRSVYVSLVTDKYEELRVTAINANFIRVNCEIIRSDNLGWDERSAWLSEIKMHNLSSGCNVGNGVRTEY